MLNRTISSQDRTGQSIHVSSDDTVISGLTTQTADFAGGMIDEASMMRKRNQPTPVRQNDNMAMLQIGNIGFGAEGNGPKVVGGKFVRCKGCCVPTHKVNMFTRKRIPLNNDRVENGRCLQCFPKNRRSQQHIIRNNSSYSGSGSQENRLPLQQDYLPPDSNTTKIESDAKPASRKSIQVQQNESGENRVISTLIQSETCDKDIRKSTATRGNLEENDTCHLNIKQKDEDGNRIEHKSDMKNIQNKMQAASFHDSIDNSTIGSEVSSLDEIENRDDLQVERNRSINILETLSDLPDIYSLMITNKLDPVFLEKACARIQNLAAEDNFLSGAGRIGLVNEVVESMDRYPDVEGIQLKGCIALNYFAESGEENKAAVADADAVPTIISCMQKYQDNGTMQNWAIQTLASLSGGNRDNKIQISVHNGVKAIVDAMNIHREWEEVQVNALKAIWSLTVNAFDNCFQVMEADGIEAILSTLNHTRGPILEDFAVGALWSLVCSNDMKIYRALANAGITEALVKIIHEHREFVKVQEKACTIVAQITANLTAETYVFVENGGVSRLVDVMCYYQESLVIQESGCNILRTLAKLSTKNRQRIVQSGGIDVIYAAIDTFQELSSSHESTATLLLTALD